MQLTAILTFDAQPPEQQALHFGLTDLKYFYSKK